MDKGAAGVMVAPPASVKTDAQIVNYFLTVADRLGDTPWVLQDFPLVTNVVIDRDFELVSITKPELYDLRILADDRELTFERDFHLVPIVQNGLTLV